MEKLRVGVLGGTGMVRLRKLQQVPAAQDILTAKRLTEDGSWTERFRRM